jgi:hypothetical protein
MPNKVFAVLDEGDLGVVAAEAIHHLVHPDLRG